MTVDTTWLGEGLVDLTLLLAEELPCTWPGHMPYQQKTFSYFTETGPDEAHLVSPCGHYQTRWLLIDEHTGTHMDAPAHFFPRPDSGLKGSNEVGTITAEQIPLSQLIGPAVVIDVSELLLSEEPPGESPAVEPKHIIEFEREHGELRPGDIVLFRSGWDELHYKEGPSGMSYATNPLVHKSGSAWPAPSADAMVYLSSKGIRCVGTDGTSMGSSHSGRAVHIAGLGSGCVFIEALANLGTLPVRGAIFFFAPLKVARGTGAPGRAFAFLPAS